MLLGPILPLLGWGPATHIFINKRAIEKIESSDDTPDGIAEILSDEKLKTIFINAGNSVDLIKANNLRNRERFYEYAHNTVPNYFTGDPVMGRYLLEEVQKSGYNPTRRAWALGWLAHQVCDGFAHKIPHAGCEGWVNSRRILAGYYCPEKEEEPIPVSLARIQMYMADHWLAEMLTDCLCYSREREYIDKLKIDLDVPTTGEVTEASTRILREFEPQLGPGYVYFEPLTDSKLRAIADYYRLIILCSFDVYRALLRAYGQDGFDSFVKASPRLARLDNLLECSISAVEQMLSHPETPWEPQGWLPEGSNNFQHSVYEYERIWRPGKYTFGRTGGLLGSIYYNRATDSLITRMADYSETHDLWPLIRLGIGTLYRCGRTQWPISGAFIRVLISQKPSSVQDTMLEVAKICGLEKYREFIPD
jgi:hypothetical protein